MNETLVAIGLGILAFFGILKKGSKETAKVIPVSEPDVTATQSLDDLYQIHGKRNGLDPMLLKAIARVESSENPNVKNPSDPSYGLMQVLCVDDGQGGCKNKFNVMGWPPLTKEQLYDPDYSLQIGAQILAWNIETYGFKRGIAVYNSWGARHDPPDGPFENQGYVDKVLREYYGLGGIIGV